MTTVNLTCPNCSTPISMNMPDNDFPMKHLLPAVHCHECYTIKAAQLKTQKRINHISDNIRNSNGKPELLTKLEGALKAQYTSAKMLRAKLEYRSSISRQKQTLESASDNRLPW